MAEEVVLRVEACLPIKALTPIPQSVTLFGHGALAAVIRRARIRYDCVLMKMGHVDPDTPERKQCQDTVSHWGALRPAEA